MPRFPRSLCYQTRPVLPFEPPSKPGGRRQPSLDVCIARYSIRDIATTLGITERTAFGIVTDLTEAGYVVKDKNGRRNRYRIQDHLPVRTEVGRDPTIGEVLGVLIDTTATECARPPGGNSASPGQAKSRAGRSRT